MKQTMKSKDKLSSIYGFFASTPIHKDREVYVKDMTEEDKNKLLQCAIDFGYVDTDNVKQLIQKQTIINKLEGETK